MALLYPSSVPDWNNLRWLTPDNVDTSDTTIQCIRLPTEYLPYFWGALSLLAEVDNWKQFGTLDTTTMVDIYNNEVELVNICDLIASCIATSDATKEALDGWIGSSPVAQGTIRQGAADGIYLQLLQPPTEPQIPTLDYVWGGIDYAMNEYDDAVIQFNIAAGQVSTVVEFVENIPGIKQAQANTLTAVKQVIDVGVAIMVAWLNDIDTRNKFACAVFEEICSRGQPYTLHADDIQAGWIELDAYNQQPIVSFSKVMELFFSTDMFMNLFRVGSDDPNNNWSQLCNCSDVSWIADVDLTSNNIMDISSNRGVYTPGVGYVAINDGNNRKIVQILIDLDDCQVQRVDFLVTETCVNPSTVPERNDIRIGYDSSYIFQTYQPCTNGTNQTITAELQGYTLIDQILTTRVPCDPFNASASATVTRMIVYGFGTAPTQLLPYII